MRLLIAVDADSAHAVSAAAGELFPNAECVVFNAVPFMSTVVPGTIVSGAAMVIPSADALLAAEKHSDVALAAAAEALPVAAVESTSVVGDPGPAVCDEAVAIGADVIVLGRSERGWLSRLFAPSVADYVVEHAPCPVLVVRHDGPSDERRAP